MVWSLALLVTLLAAAAMGCGRATSSPLDGTATPAPGNAPAKGAETGALLELQRELGTGHDVVWYTQRLTELDYRVERIRQADDGVVAYRVRKGGEAFDVLVAVDERTATARSVEIRPQPVEDAGLLADAETPADRSTQAVAEPTEERVAAHRRNDASTSRPAPAASRDAASGTGSANQPANSGHTSGASQNGAPAARAPVDITPAPEPAAPPRTAEPTVSAPAPAPVTPRRRVVTLPSGSRIATSLGRDLSSADAQVGDVFAMRVDEAVWVGNDEVVPAGARVWGRVAEVERAARPNKGGRLVLVADAVIVDGDELPLDAVVTADGERLEGRNSTREDIKEVAIGAGLGGLVGGLLGGKKGVLVGVLVGGGGTFVATKGEEVKLPADTPLLVELRRDLDVTFIESP